MREAVARLAERARAESWTHEEFLVACLQREVSARESHGGEGRIRAARFPSRKSLEEFDFDHARGLKRDTIAHLGTLDFVVAKDNVVFLGPPGTGKTHLAIRHRDPGLPSRPSCPVRDRLRVGRPAGRSSSRRAPPTGTDPAGPLPAACRRRGRLYPVRTRSRQPVLPAGVLPLRTGFSLIVTSNKPFGRWGEVFGDDVVAAAMIDRLVHHAEVIALKGDSYRIKDRDLGRVPGSTTEE